MRAIARVGAEGNCQSVNVSPVSDSSGEALPALPTLGERIGEAIARSGLSKSEVARRLDTSYVTVHRWTTGESEPKITFLRQLPEVLGVTLEELLAIAEGQDPPFDAWHRFLETPEGKSISPDERRGLQSFAWPMGIEPTVSSYLALLMAARSGVPRS